jgi:hypothetical protein
MPLRSIGGEPVWSWRTNGLGTPDPAITFYLIELGDSYILLSNSLEELRQIVNSFISPHHTSREPSDVPGWESLNQHEYWGYRRPVSSSDRGAVVLSELLPDARALMLFCDTNQKTAILRLIDRVPEHGAGPRATECATMFLSDTKFKEGGPRVWEAEIPLSGQDTWGQIASLMGLFGFVLII